MRSIKYAIRIFNSNTAMPFYAVACGRRTGIFDTWDKCSEQVKGFKGAKYKKFEKREEAEIFINGNNDAKHKFELSRELAVPLGRKGPPPAKWAKLTKPAVSQKSAALETSDIWPKSDGDDFTDTDITNDELIGAVLAAEITKGKSAISTVASLRKRKHNDISSDTIRSYSTNKLRHRSKIWQPVGTTTFDDHEFQIDEEDFVIVYTDGSCLNNGRKNACAGYGVYFGDDHPLNASEAVRGRVTNNVGEIQAAIHAIKAAKNVGIKKLCISTDSQFLINSVTSWMRAWKSKGWRLKDGGPVKNVVDFKELDKLLEEDDDFQVKWNYVKAHKGIHGNEMADKLARQGSELYKELH